MMKNLLVKMFLSVFLMAGFSTLSFASGGAAGASGSKFQSIIGAGLSSAYASVNAAKCHWRKNPKPCIEAIKAIKQVVEMFQSAGTSHGVAMTLSNGGDGSFTFDPADAGFCFDPSSGCSPDAVDTSLSGFGDAFATGKGYEDAFATAEKAALDQLKDLEKQGVKIDLEAGTVTDGSGNITSLNGGISGKIPSSLSKSASEKLSGIQKAIGEGSSKRNIASAAGAGGSKGLGSLSVAGLNDDFQNGLGKAKKKDVQGKFLAGLSDKDAGLNGVGFAGDDIFNMIKRRYTKKLSGKEFIEK